MFTHNFALGFQLLEGSIWKGLDIEYLNIYTLILSYDLGFREGVKKMYFLGIIPQPMNLPPPLSVH